MALKVCVRVYECVFKNNFLCYFLLLSFNDFVTILSLPAFLEELSGVIEYCSLVAFLFQYLYEKLKFGESFELQYAQFLTKDHMISKLSFQTDRDNKHK